MHLHQLMGWPGPMTERQFILWQQWQARQWHRPDRTDHYIMQVTQAMLDKERDLRIPFKFEQPSQQKGDGSGFKFTRELAAKVQKSKYRSVIYGVGEFKPPEE